MKTPQAWMKHVTISTTEHQIVIQGPASENKDFTPFNITIDMTTVCNDPQHTLVDQADVEHPCVISFHSTQDKVKKSIEARAAWFARSRTMRIDSLQDLGFWMELTQRRPSSFLLAK